MIRNAVIHLANEQPLLADLFELPAPRDLGLRCTNLRTLAGARPVFADRSDSVFFFPYAHIRFLEMPPEAAALAAGGVEMTGAGIEIGAPAPDAEAAATPAPEPEEEVDLEIDEDFLRRIRDV